MLDECYDMELYEWVKADISDPVRCFGCAAHSSAPAIRACLAMTTSNLRQLPTGASSCSTWRVGFCSLIVLLCAEATLTLTLTLTKVQPEPFVSAGAEEAHGGHDCRGGDHRWLGERRGQGVQVSSTARFASDPDRCL